MSKHTNEGTYESQRNRHPWNKSYRWMNGGNLACLLSKSSKNPQLQSLPRASGFNREAHRTLQLCRCRNKAPEQAQEGNDPPCIYSILKISRDTIVTEAGWLRPWALKWCLGPLESWLKLLKAWIRVHDGVPDSCNSEQEIGPGQKDSG